MIHFVHFTVMKNQKKIFQLLKLVWRWNGITGDQSNPDGIDNDEWVKTTGVTCEQLESMTAFFTKKKNLFNAELVSAREVCCCTVVGILQITSSSSIKFSKLFPIHSMLRCADTSWRKI